MKAEQRTGGQVRQAGNTGAKKQQTTRQSEGKQRAVTRTKPARGWCAGERLWGRGSDDEADERQVWWSSGGKQHRWAGSDSDVEMVYEAWSRSSNVTSSPVARRVRGEIDQRHLVCKLRSIEGLLMRFTQTVSLALVWFNRRLFCWHFYSSFKYLGCRDHEKIAVVTILVQTYTTRVTSCHMETGWPGRVVFFLNNYKLFFISRKVADNCDQTEAEKLRRPRTRFQMYFQILCSFSITSH